MLPVLKCCGWFGFLISTPNLQRSLATEGQLALAHTEVATAPVMMPLGGQQGLPHAGAATAPVLTMFEGQHALAYAGVATAPVMMPLGGQQGLPHTGAATAPVLAMFKYGQCRLASIRGLCRSLASIRGLCSLATKHGLCRLSRFLLLLSSLQRHSSARWRAP